MKTNSIEITLKDYTHVAQVLADSGLINATNNAVNNIFHRLRNRPLLPKGEVYIKTLYEKMNDDGQLDAEFLIQEYAEIRMKKSNLSSQRRAVVSDVVEEAINELLDQNKLTVVPGSVFAVRNSRARMKVVSIDNEEETLVISFKKKRETWSFIKLIDGIRSNVLIMTYDKDKERL